MRISKITDDRIISQLNSKLYPVNKHKKYRTKRKLMCKPGYITRDDVSKLLSYSVYVPSGDPCFIFITSIDIGYVKHITVLIKDGIFYNTDTVTGIITDTLIFGYIENFIFYAMDVLTINGVSMTNVKRSVSRHKHQKPIEYKISFRRRRRFVEQFVEVVRRYNKTVTLQAVYNIGELCNMKSNVLLFYNNHYNVKRILKWTSTDMITINTKCTRNMISENMDHKIYNPIHKNYYTVVTNTMYDDAKEDDICSFLVKGQTELEYLGVNTARNAKQSDTLEYKAAINFCNDYITHDELRMIYK
jgi:hypothetical protein